MATRVLFTIDTELAWRHHAAGLGWQENYARSIEPAGVGLGYQLARFAEHGLKAVCFVDPMPAALFGPEPVRRIVETVLEAGQEVQLHVHPTWAEARRDGSATPDAVFELTGLSREEQQAMIESARDMLVAAGAPPPVAFRAGSYGADDATLDALAALGIAYDSSHNGCEHPWPSAIGLPPGQTAPVRHRGVIELPVSQIAQPGGSLRHLQVCAVSAGEMALALDHAVAADQPVLTLISHSFELATRDGLRPNRVVRSRFDRLCRLLADRRDEAPTVHFADLQGLPLGGEADAPAAPARLVAWRMAEQALANSLEKVGR